jgi:hypothetical protein
VSSSLIGVFLWQQGTGGSLAVGGSVLRPADGRIAPAHRCVPSRPMDASTSRVASGEQRLMARSIMTCRHWVAQARRPPDCYPSPIICFSPSPGAIERAENEVCEATACTCHDISSPLRSRSSVRAASLCLARWVLKSSGGGAQWRVMATAIPCLFHNSLILLSFKLSLFICTMLPSWICIEC